MNAPDAKSSDALLERGAAVRFCGHESMRSDAIYYFLYSSPTTQLVWLCEFIEPSAPDAQLETSKREPEWRAELLALPRDKFEPATRLGKVTVDGSVQKLPPWLHTVGVKALGRSKRREMLEEHVDRINRRIQVIGDVLEMRQILDGADPIRLLNSAARCCTPKQNECRFRLWAITYWLFGRDGLHYSVGRIGRWDRTTPGRAKCGPKVKDGRPQGFPMHDPELRKRIVKSYQKHATLTMPWAKVYDISMREDFGCKAIVRRRGVTELYHPESKPFPSLRQYKHCVIKELGLSRTQKNRRGDKYYRTHIAPATGSFTERTVNICERAEYDPFYLQARPRSVVNNSVLKAALTVGRLRDSASGKIIGVSFDLGGETTVQLNAALFCAAIPWAKFCYLFGVKPRAHHVLPATGIPVELILDRGAGAAIMKVYPQRELDREGPAIFELAPQGAGQGKAVVESSHPKKQKHEEGGVEWDSGMKVYELVKQEIRRVEDDNEKLNVIDRFATEWLADAETPTPWVLYGILASLGRNDAMQIEFDRAVRKYLPKVSVTATKEHVYLQGRPFNCTELKESGFFRKVAKAQELNLQAYHLNACVRYIWFEYEGHLYELAAQFALNTGATNEYVSLADLILDQEQRSRLRRNLDPHRQGVAAQGAEAFHEDTGRKFDQKRITRRRKRGAESAASTRQEVKYVRGRS
jgi:hypothetical protein